MPKPLPQPRTPNVLIKELEFVAWQHQKRPPAPRCEIPAPEHTPPEQELPGVARWEAQEAPSTPSPDLGTRVPLQAPMLLDQSIINPRNSYFPFHSRHLFHCPLSWWGSGGWLGVFVLPQNTTEKSTFCLLHKILPALPLLEPIQGEVRAGEGGSREAQARGYLRMVSPTESRARKFHPKGNGSADTAGVRRERSPGGAAKSARCALRAGESVLNIPELLTAAGSVLRKAGDSPARTSPLLQRREEPGSPAEGAGPRAVRAAGILSLGALRRWLSSGDLPAKS